MASVLSWNHFENGQFYVSFTEEDSYVQVCADGETFTGKKSDKKWQLMLNICFQK